MDIVFLVARILFAFIFAGSAIGHLTQSAGMAQYAKYKGAPGGRFGVIFTGISDLLRAQNGLPPSGMTFDSDQCLTIDVTGINGAAPTIRNQADAYIRSGTIAGGVGTLSFKYRKPFSDSTMGNQVYVIGQDSTYTGTVTAVPATTNPSAKRTDAV